MTYRVCQVCGDEVPYGSLWYVSEWHIKNRVVRIAGHWRCVEGKRYEGHS